MRKIISGIVAAIVLVSLSGCGSSTTVTVTATPSEAPSSESNATQNETQVPEETPPPTEESTDEAEQPAEPNVSERGLTVKNLNEWAWTSGNSDRETIDDADFKMRITDFKLDMKCTGDYSSKPSKGTHFLGVQIEAQSSKDLEDVLDYGTTMDTSSYYFTLIDADGYKVSDPAPSETYGCLESSDELPREIGPAQKVKGWLVFVTPTKHGVLSYAPWGEGNGGWEWSF